MLETYLKRLGVILGIAIVAIWGIMMLNRPSKIVVIVEDVNGLGVTLLAKMKRERDSLIQVLATYRQQASNQVSEDSEEDSSIPAKVPSELTSPSVNEQQKTTKSAQDILGEKLAKQLIQLADGTTLRDVSIYDRGLREQFSVANFASYLERSNVRARLTAMREMAIAHKECKQTGEAGCRKLLDLSKDNRLTLKQQQLAYELRK